MKAGEIIHEAPCIEPGCTIRIAARQRCTRHYQAWRRDNQSEQCNFCNRITISERTGTRRDGRALTISGQRRVVCRAHLPNLLNENRTKNLERLGDWIDIDPLSDSDCWIINSRNRDGYGYVRPVHCRQRIYAHHFSYALFVGGWTRGQQIHHRCQRAECANPAHLEALTLKQHAARAKAKPTVKPLPTFRHSDGYALAAGFAREYGLPFDALADLELTAA